MYNEKGKKGFAKNNPGKPNGAVNKNSKLIKEIFVDAFNALQESEDHNITKWAQDNKSDFYKLAVRLIPTQIQISANVSIIDEPVTFE